jgi:hypothetical protein
MTFAARFISIYVFILCVACKHNCSDMQPSGPCPDASTVKNFAWIQARAPLGCGTACPMAAFLASYKGQTVIYFEIKGGACDTAGRRRFMIAAAKS